MLNKKSKGLDSVENKKKRKRSFLVQYVRNRLLNLNANFIAIVEGGTGSGKSYSCIGFAMAIDPYFSIDNIVFTVKDLLDFVKYKKYKGAVIIFEEAGVSLHNMDFWSGSNKGTNKILQTFRRDNMGLLLNSPESSFIDGQTIKLIHCIMDTAGINRKVGYCKLNFAFIKQNRYNRNKPYRNPLRIYNKETHSWENCNEVAVLKPPEDLLMQYEKKKYDFNEKLKVKVANQLAKKMK